MGEVLRCGRPHTQEVIVLLTLSPEVLITLITVRHQEYQSPPPGDLPRPQRPHQLSLLPRPSLQAEHQVTHTAPEVGEVRVEVSEVSGEVTAPGGRQHSLEVTHHMDLPLLSWNVTEVSH